MADSGEALEKVTEVAAKPAEGLTNALSEINPTSGNLFKEVMDSIDQQRQSEPTIGTSEPTIPDIPQTFPDTIVAQEAIEGPIIFITDPNTGFKSNIEEWIDPTKMSKDIYNQFASNKKIQVALEEYRRNPTAETAQILYNTQLENIKPIPWKESRKACPHGRAPEECKECKASKS